MIRATAPKQSPPGADFCSGETPESAFCFPKTSRQSGARKETDKESIGLVEVLA